MARSLFRPIGQRNPRRSIANPTERLTMKFYALILVLLFPLVSCGQETKAPFALPDEVSEPVYDDNLDLSALVDRVDDLTGVVNTHTEQLEQLNERVKALESKPVGVTIKKNLLGTELKQPKPLSTGSVGTVITSPVTSYGSTGTIVSSPVVWTPPVVTNYQPVYNAPLQPTYSRTRSVQVTAPQSRFGGRLGFFQNCPGGVCPR